MALEQMPERKAKFNVEGEIVGSLGNKSRNRTSALIWPWFSAAGAALLVLHRKMARSGAASAEIKANPRRSAGSIPDAGKGQKSGSSDKSLCFSDHHI